MSNKRDLTAEYLQQRRLTARNLQDFELCPQKYLLSLSVAPAEARQFIGGPAALQWAVRGTLIDCYRRGGPHEISQQSLLDLFEQHWEGELCADSLEERQLHSRGIRLLTDYYQPHHQAPNQTIAVDLRLTAEIAGHDFAAVADRVDRDESGVITLLRYKTSASPPGPGMLAKDISAGLLLLLALPSTRAPVPRTWALSVRLQIAGLPAVVRLATARVWPAMLKAASFDIA